MNVIQLREECESTVNQMKSKLKVANAEKADMHFLSNQKDFKIEELDKQLIAITAKLEKVLLKVFSPAAHDIVKGHRGKDDVNIVARK